MRVFSFYGFPFIYYHLNTCAMLQNQLQAVFHKGLTYHAYREAVEQLVAQKKTSGSNQSEAMIHYTQLNHQRMNRWDKKAHLSTTMKTVLNHLKQSLNVLIFTEAWCGDAAHNIPVIAKMGSYSAFLNLRLIYRDEHPKLMEHFLTNGGKSIPKAVVLNEKFEVLFTWGPRPAPCQQLYLDMKDRNTDFETVKTTLQKWYNKDRQETLQREWITAFEQFAQ